MTASRKPSGFFDFDLPNAMAPRGLLDPPPPPANAMAPQTRKNIMAALLGERVPEARHNAMAAALLGERDPADIMPDRRRRAAWVNTAGEFNVLFCIDARGCPIYRDANNGAPGSWDADHTIPGLDIESNLRALNSSSNRSEGDRPWLRWPSA